MLLRSGRLVRTNSDLHNSSSFADLLEFSASDHLSEPTVAFMDPQIPPQMPEGSVQEDNEQHNQIILRPLREYLHPARQTTPSCIELPLGHQNCNFKLGTIQLLPTFHGMDSENPYMHMKEFEDVCGTCMDRNANEDIVRLKLFPFSLKDKAKMWLNSLEPRSIGTWRDMQTKFLKKYFPANRTVILQQQIMNFACKPNETFAQAWERFKELLQACPHHSFESWRIVNFFHNALTPNLKMLVATMCNGEFYDKTAEEALHFFDSLAENTKQWEVVASPFSEISDSFSARGKFHLKETDDLGARLAALSRKVELMEQKKQGLKEKEVNCVLCETLDHRTDDCPTLLAFKDVLYGQANPAPAARPFNANQYSNANQGNQPYSNAYNSGYKGHSNVSWRNDAQNQQYQPQQPFQPQPFHSQPYQPQQNTNFYQPPHKRTLEDTLQQFMQGQIGTNNQNSKFQDQTNRAMEDIRSQLSKLTQALTLREAGKLPSQPKPNPSGQVHFSESSSSGASENLEHVQAVSTLRSGKKILKPDYVPIEGQNDQDTMESEEEVQQKQRLNTRKEVAPKEQEDEEETEKDQLDTSANTAHKQNLKMEEQESRSQNPKKVNSETETAGVEKKIKNFDNKITLSENKNEFAENKTELLNEKQLGKSAEISGNKQISKEQKEDRSDVVSQIPFP